MNANGQALVEAGKFAWRQIARIPATIVIGAAAVAVALVPSGGNILQLDRAALAVGEFWRLATCHLTHWNAEHLQWDLLMFLVLGGICELRDSRQMRRCVMLAGMVVTLLVVEFFPRIVAYRGLSGIDSALFTMLAVGLVRDARRDDNRPLEIAASVLLVGFAAKTGYEAITQQTMFVDRDAAGFVPLVWDHIAAGVVGTVVALLPSVRNEEAQPLLTAA